VQVQGHLVHKKLRSPLGSTQGRAIYFRGPLLHAEILLGTRRPFASKKIEFAWIRSNGSSPTDPPALRSG